MNIRQASEIDRGIWDDFVNNHDDSVPYHLFAWTKAVQQAYGFKSFNLIAEESGKIVGIFPMTMLKIPFSSPKMIALPYCDVGSLLSTNINVTSVLLEKAISIALTYKATILDIRGAMNIDSTEVHGYPVQRRRDKVRMLLHLPGSSTELWQEFKAKLRSQIRKAEKNGLRFQFGNEKINDFYKVFSINMRELGSPVHSKKWFERVIAQFGNNAKVGLVYCEGNVIGAGIILRVGDRISIPWASTLRTHNKLGPNMLLYWKFLEYAADNSCAIFDFGRSTPGEGTYNFKSQWGAEPEPLNWYTIILNGSIKNCQSSSMLHRALAERMWRKLPLCLTNIVGPSIRQYISL